MKALFLLALVAAPALAQTPAAPATPAPVTQPAPAEQVHAPATPKAAPIYDESADTKKDIAAALARAGKNNTRVLIQWGANWCSWCRILHGVFTTDDNIRKQLYGYEVVHADIGKWDKNTDLIEHYGADIKKHGVPYLTILGPDGKVIANQDTGELELKSADKQGYDLDKIIAFLKAHQAQYIKAEDALARGLEQAKSSGKKVFLHFGAPWCGWCHRLEGWMAREEVNELLAKDYIDQKIDEDRMVGGKDVEAHFRTDTKGGIPWFAITDAQGKILATSDGPEGNTGFPSKPAEVAHFLTMLRKTATHLTAADIAKLGESLAEKPSSGAH
jgi:thiol-disulfide isomerase/thioredoxin